MCYFRTSALEFSFLRSVSVVFLGQSTEDFLLLCSYCVLYIVLENSFCSDSVYWYQCIFLARQKGRCVSILCSVMHFSFTSMPASSFPIPKLSCQIKVPSIFIFCLWNHQHMLRIKDRNYYIANLKLLLVTIKGSFLQLLLRFLYLLI